MSSVLSSAPSSAAPELVALRSHYRLYRDPADPSTCVRESRTRHGLEMLPTHYEGWQITHDLLGRCAPRHALFDGARIRTELIPGRALHLHYGGGPASSDTLPWNEFWEALGRLYDSGRKGPTNPKLIPEMAWTTWCSIGRLHEAKRHARRGFGSAPLWSIAAGMRLVRGKLAGGFTRPPPTAYEISNSSRRALLLGDLHMANLVGGSDRIAFVDFSEVGEGPVALDLAPIWLEWWLARGLCTGDDGFIDGYRELWRRFVGPEALLIRMTAEWVARIFPWMLFAFYSDHLELSRAKAYAAAGDAAHRIDLMRSRLTHASRLDKLVAESQ